MLGKDTTTNTTDNASNHADAKSSNVAFYSKVALSALAGIAAIYYGGPIAAVTARTLFDSYYEHQYGVLPSLLSTDYWKIYMPMREHIGAQAYKYGPQGFGAISAFVAYKTSQAIGWATGKIAGKKSSPQIFEQTPTIASEPITNIEVKTTLPDELLIQPINDAIPLLEIKVEQSSVVEIDDQKLDEEIEKIIQELMALDINAHKDEVLTKEYTMADLEKEFQNLTFIFEKELKQEIKPDDVKVEQQAFPKQKSLGAA